MMTRQSLRGLSEGRDPFGADGVSKIVAVVQLSWTNLLTAPIDAVLGPSRRQAYPFDICIA